MKWGSVCGALTPAINFIGHVVAPAQAGPLIEELMAWYEQTAFPIYQPNGPVPTTIANSTLCHVSTTKWLNETGEEETSPLKKERCGGLTADVVAKTIEMLDNYFSSSFGREFYPAAVVEECKTCHDHAPIAVAGKESCTNCHDINPSHYPSKKKK